MVRGNAALPPCPWEERDPGGVLLSSGRHVKKGEISDGHQTAETRCAVVPASRQTRSPEHARSGLKREKDRRWKSALSDSAKWA